MRDATTEKRGSNSVEKSEEVRGLSRRNCEALLQQLARHSQDLGLVPTRCGDAYVTRGQLDSELRQFVACRGGRANLSEIQRELDVASATVRKRVEALVASGEKGDKAGFQLVSGDVLSHKYILQITEEVNDSLRSRGFLAFQHIARQYGLPLQFSQDIARSGVAAGTIRGKIRGQAIVTGMYESRVHARVRGALRARTTPTRLQDVADSLGIDPAEAMSVCEAMASSGELPGLFSPANGGLYTPYIFRAHQDAVIQTAWASEGYVSHETARDLRITAPAKALKKRFSSALHLSTCAVAQRRVAQVMESLQMCQDQGSFLNIESLNLPLTSSEAESLLAHCVRKVTGSRKVDRKRGNGPSVVLVTPTHAASRAFLESQPSKIDAYIDQSAAKLRRRIGALRTGQQEPGPDVSVSEIASRVARAWDGKLNSAFVGKIADLIRNNVAEQVVERARAKDGYIDGATRSRIRGILQEMLDFFCVYYDASERVRTGASGVKANETTANGLRRYLLRTLGKKAFDVLVNADVMYSQLQVPGDSKAKANASGSSNRVNPAISQLTAARPSDQVKWIVENASSAEASAALEGMQSAINSCDCGLFLRSFESSAQMYSVRVMRPDDGKRESLLSRTRKRMAGLLARETRPKQVLQYTVLLLHSHATGGLVHAPFAMVDDIVRTVTPLLSPEAKHALETLANVVHSGRNTSGSQPNAAPTAIKQCKELGAAPKAAFA